MAPIPYDSHREISTTVGFVCPHCGQSLHTNRRTVSCTDCDYVPRQGAD